MFALYAALLVTGCDAPPAEHPPKIERPAPFAFPALTGRVVDQAELLDPEARAKIAQSSAALEQATGHQFVTVTLSSLNGQDIDDYGLALGNHWGIGRAEHDDGILLIVAPNERQVRIEVGRCLGEKMSDQRAKRIIDEQLLPAFRQGRMQAGILAGAQKIVDVLSHEDRPQ